MDTTNSNIKVFGQPEVDTLTQEITETATNEVETTTVEKPEVKNQKETLDNNTPEKKEAKVEEIKEVVKPEIDKKAEVKSEPKDETHLKVNFDIKPETSTKDKAPLNEATPLVTESSVIDYLNSNIEGLNLKSISDISALSQPKEELPESVAKFKKFVEETGRTSLEEFYNVQRDWSKEPKDGVLTEFFKSKYPQMSAEDIQEQVELITVTEEDEDTLTDRELRQRKSDYNKTYSEALGFVTKMSKDYAVPLEKSTLKPQEPSQEDIAKAHKPYWDKRDKSIRQLNELKFNIEGIGEIVLPVDQEAKDIVLKTTETVDAMINKYDRDKNGLINTDSLVEDTLWGSRETRQKLIVSMLEQANALILDNYSKKNRNVNLDKQKIETNEIESSAKLERVGNQPQNTTAGRPIF